MIGPLSTDKSIQDGPKDKPEGVVVSQAELKARIHNPSILFGHGFVIAGLLAGVEPKSYCQ